MHTSSRVIRVYEEWDQGNCTARKFYFSLSAFHSSSVFDGEDHYHRDRWKGYVRKSYNFQAYASKLPVSYECDIITRSNKWRQSKAGLEGIFICLIETDEKMPRLKILEKKKGGSIRGRG